jgi:hypothetical protein
MEKVDWEREVSNRKKAYQEGIDRDVGHKDESRFTDKAYLESKRLWKEFLAGRATSEDLQRNLKGYNGETPDNLTDIKDMFLAEEI